jgi:hypothetical protein
MDKQTIGLSFRSKSARLAVVMAATLSVALGSVVEQVTLEQMLKNSQLVFEGTVIGISPHLNPSSSEIETDIAFRVSDVIKGSFSEPVIVLTFSGGTVGTITQRIGDMRMPHYGEHGVYFVESLARKQVHPLYGWDQGHFLVKTNDSGVGIVTTLNSRPVLSLQTAKKNPPTGFSSRIAIGVQIADEATDARALSIEQFKYNLRQIAARLQ